MQYHITQIICNESTVLYMIILFSIHTIIHFIKLCIPIYAHKLCFMTYKLLLSLINHTYLLEANMCKSSDMSAMLPPLHNIGSRMRGVSSLNELHLLEFLLNIQDYSDIIFGLFRKIKDYPGLFGLFRKIKDYEN